MTSSLYKIEEISQKQDISEKDDKLDFVNTDKSFADAFTNMEQGKLYYVDGEAYKISKVEDNTQYEENHLPKQSQKWSCLLWNSDCCQPQDHRSFHPSFAEVANLNKPLLKQTATQENLKKLSVWTRDTLWITRMLYE